MLGAERWRPVEGQMSYVMERSLADRDELMAPLADMSRISIVNIRAS